MSQSYLYPLISNRNKIRLLFVYSCTNIPFGQTVVQITITQSLLRLQIYDTFLLNFLYCWKLDVTWRHLPSNTESSMLLKTTGYVTLSMRNKVKSFPHVRVPHTHFTSRFKIIMIPHAAVIPRVIIYLIK